MVSAWGGAGSQVDHVVKGFAENGAGDDPGDRYISQNLVPALGFRHLNALMFLLDFRFGVFRARFAELNLRGQAFGGFQIGAFDLRHRLKGVFLPRDQVLDFLGVSGATTKIEERLQAVGVSSR